jgi:hypothetical protein
MGRVRTARLALPQAEERPECIKVRPLLLLLGVLETSIHGSLNNQQALPIKEAHPERAHLLGEGRSSIILITLVDLI